MAPAVVAPPGAQGPGPMPAAAVDALDLALVRRTAGALPGEHRGLGVGVGTELAQLRPYVFGDDVRQIDPSASARTGVPHVRQQIPDRALTTWVVLDLSPSMAFGTAVRLKSDVAEGVVRVVSRLGVRRGGRVSLLTCGTGHVKALPPRGGRRAIGAIRRALEQGVATDGPAQTGDGLGAALLRLRGMARQPGLVVIVSDFRDPTDWGRPLRALAARHRVLGAEVVDPRETQLVDAGLVVLVDPEDGRQVEVDTSSKTLRETFARAEAERRERLRQTLRRAGARYLELNTSTDWLRALGRGLA
jgi:uncharacterized protein (DUF58 family)